jgi:dTDP-4-dehydrorhamnose reductase
MLGKDVVDVLSRDDGIELFGFDRIVNPRLQQDRQILGDLTDIASLENILRDLGPQTIIHCAAITSVDVCESDRSAADAIHRAVTDTLSSFQTGSTRFILISSDSVFDGARGTTPRAILQIP